MKTTAEKHFDVIVIGGGAAGMMAAGRASERGRRVLLLEKNKKLGEKLRISGGGRCNITNAEFDERTLLKNYGAGEQFLYSPFSQFGVQDTFDFFASRGLSLVVQEGRRAFPHTEKAIDVYTVLYDNLVKTGVVIKTHSPVTHIEKNGDTIVSVSVGEETYTADSYILATGGVSHPETGSTGDGFAWLRGLGHTVSKPTPSVVPLAVSDSWIRSLSGKSLPDVKITFFQHQKKQFTKTGKILCTHFGVSGPMILNSAHLVADLLHGGVVTASVDLFPKVDMGELDKTLIAQFEIHKNKAFKNVLRELVPPGTTSGIMMAFSDRIDPEIKVHSVTKEQRRAVAHLLKALPLTITGLMGFDRAVVADGGVPLSEIDTRTMCSKKIKNLYIIGDLLDINRPSGGYSLQLCWTTGFVAGDHV